MTTWTEARAAKANRLKRESRYYTADKLGAACVVCGNKLPKALTAAGINAHPTCGPDVVMVMGRNR